MFEHPDSALDKLKMIDLTQLKSVKEKALYDLLYTQALYTNYLPIDNDSLLSQALSFFDKDEEPRYWAWSHFYEGCRKQDNDSLEAAMIEFLTIQTIAESLQEDRFLERLFNHLADIYYKESFFDKSAYYYSKVIPLARSIPDSVMLAYSLNMLACSNLYRNDSNVLVPLSEAKIITESIINHDNPITSVYYSLSTFYSRQNNADSALYYALKASEVNRNSVMESSINNIIGVAYTEKNEADSAISYFMEASNSLNISVKRMAYMCLSDIETAMGNSQKALEYERLYSAYQDSVEAQSQRVDIKNAEKAVALMKTKENNKREKKTYFYVIIVLFFVAIVITVIACRRIKNHRALIRNTEEKLKFITKQLQTVSDKLRTKTDLLEIMKCQTEEYGINAGRVEQLQKEIINLNAQRHAIISEIAAHSTIYQKLSRIIAQGHAKGVAIERMEESDWIELVSVTSQLYPDLILTLRRDYGLKEADIRFCSLVLADYNLNELSFVLLRTSSAVHKRAKYILHTKLGFTDALPSSLRDALLSIKPTPSLNQ